RVRQRTVTVRRFLEHTLDLFFAPRGRDLAVEHQPLVHVRDVRVIDTQINAQVDRGTDVVLELFTLELPDRLLEELHVHLEANRIDLPALLAAQQIAGAANLEVERRDAEAAAEVAELFDRRQPFLRD